MALQTMPKTVLFVCRGNYCRSPMAEGVFGDEARKIGFAAICDSAGTSPECLGSAPDWRAQMIARRNRVDISHQRSRAVCRQDFYAFDFILAMDTSNLSDLCREAPRDGRARVSLLWDMVSGARGKSVRDPFCGNVGDFADCWRQLRSATRVIAKEIAHPCL